MTGALIFFVKAPRPGRVKTRLAPVLGPENAARLYAAFGRDMLESLGRAGLDPLVFFAPAGAEAEVRAWLGSGHELVPQQGADLAERMNRAFELVFARGARRAVIVGSDLPGLPPEHVASALGALERSQSVLGRAEDGGYYLIGFARRAFSPLFIADAHRAKRPGPALAEALAEAGLDPARVPDFADVDTPAGLKALQTRLARDPSRAPRTWNLLNETISMQRPRRLLFVVTEDWYFLSHRLELAKAASRAGWEVFVATAPGSRGAEIEAAGLTHLTMRLSRGSLNPAKELVAIRDIIAVMREVKPDIAHLVAVKPILYGAVAARLARVPGVVCAVAGLGYLFVNRGPGALVMRALATCIYRRFVCGQDNVRVIVQNPDDKALLENRCMARPEQFATVRGSGVDLARFAPAPEPEGAPVVLCHSRMLWDKGIAELVEAADILRSRGVVFELLLAGDADPHNPRSIDPATLKEWSASGRAKWLGRRTDVAELLAKCHLACLPSYREGMPLSLIEAAAAGRAVVTTDVPGCREVVEDGVNGLLVPARDPLALADALQRLMADGPARRRMAAAGRARARELFGLERVIRDTLAVYQSLEEDS